MPNPASARKPRQSRSRATRQKITEAVIALLGEHGEAAVTHRAIAKRAGVSLAATTYYYDSRTALLADASQALLDRYVAQFKDFVDRHRHDAPAPDNLRRLMLRVIDNATSRDRQQTIAWAEIMVFCSRHADTRELAATWYSTLYEVWSQILALMGETPDRVRLRVLIDQIVGLLFLMLPLHWKAEDVRARLELQPRAKPASRTGRKRAIEPAIPAENARNRIVEAAIRLLAREGSAAVTGRAVAAEAGVAPALPAYHFKPLDSLMSAARERLYEREKARYREARTSVDPSELTPGRLADLTTAILLREVTQYGDLNLASLSVEAEATRESRLRPMVEHWVNDQIEAWSRQFERLGYAGAPSAALLSASLFTGARIRLLSTGSAVSDLAEVRETFDYAFATLRDSRNPL
ncbi:MULTISPECIES: TetR/AcrR family transcriptional regulator [Hydrocarboniphaga]|uniref:HTH tetR-type domain-containing protein n=3 Tax=Hydrocarboniphaga effusa TaxID=243629 RepID=I7ZF84_9GAMM|nr:MULTISPECIES: TetR family transcriptional regulator [Hydrocarboniphaga]EIT70549.1 hypothetical protein WQQ_06860 [Hydrocarboniphaga effusa AP103]MDZ4077586.1 TetR family transcriptional regulator [Hydrocarboniphaga sp.]